jgi:phytoene synthase
MSAIFFPNQATPAGSTAYYVCRSAPASSRNTLAAIFQFRQTLFELYGISDPGVARLKLQWWQQQLMQTPTGATHPLVETLAPLLTDNLRLKEQMGLLFQSVDGQLHRQHYPDCNALSESADAIGGTIALMILGSGDYPVDEYAVQAGGFILLTEWFQQLGRLTRQNIHLLPNDLIAKHQLDRQQFLLDMEQKKVNQAVADLAIQLFSDNRFDRISPAKGPLGAYLKLRKRLFALLEKENFDVMHQRISLTPLSKAWTAFW